MELAELAEEGPLQRPERGSGLGEDPSVEVIRCASWTGLWCGGAAELLTGGAGVPFAAELDVVVRLGFLVAALAFRMGSRRPWGAI